MKQGRALCGPATIEMVFRYWGITQYDQYDIAYNILISNPNEARVKKSGILNREKIDWPRYPGTGTRMMREFLKRFAMTKNHKYKALSNRSYEAEQQKEEAWDRIQNHLSNGVPAIVHQYWKGAGSRGHYRVVTGYDEHRQEVYLNDANPGEKIVQTYSDFFRLWNVNEPWLHYNAIVFNVHGKKLDVNMQRYERQK